MSASTTETSTATPAAASPLEAAAARHPASLETTAASAKLLLAGELPALRSALSKRRGAIPFTDPAESAWSLPADAA